MRLRSKDYSLISWKEKANVLSLVFNSILNGQKKINHFLSFFMLFLIIISFHLIIMIERRYHTINTDCRQVLLQKEICLTGDIQYKRNMLCSKAWSWDPKQLFQGTEKKVLKGTQKTMIIMKNEAKWSMMLSASVENSSFILLLLNLKGRVLLQSFIPAVVL